MNLVVFLVEGDRAPAGPGCEVGLRLCGGNGYVPANARTVSAWFYLRPDSDSVPPQDPSSQIGERLTTSTGLGATRGGPYVDDVVID